MAHELTTSYLRDSLTLFRRYKTLTEQAMAQVTDEQLLIALDSEMNSIALIVKHLAGNMRSRWTDVLVSDGEKPDRQRDTEFENPPATQGRIHEDVGRGMELRLRCSGAFVGCGYRPHGHDPRRTALVDAGDQPSDRALRLSLRADRIPGETPASPSIGSR